VCPQNKDIFLLATKLSSQPGKYPPALSQGQGGETISGCFIQHSGNTSSSLLEPVGGKIGVALGHGNVLVPQELLHVEETRPAHDRHGREGVPEVMDAEVLHPCTQAGLWAGNCSG